MTLPSWWTLLLFWWRRSERRVQHGDALAMLAFVGRMRALLWRAVHEDERPGVASLAREARDELGDAEVTLAALVRLIPPQRGVAHEQER